MLNGVGEEIWPDLKMMTILIPAVMLPTVVGVWLGGHLCIERLRVFITVLLVILAVFLIFNPLALLK